MIEFDIISECIIMQYSQVRNRYRLNFELY